MIRTCHKISKKNDNLVSIAVMAGRVAKHAYQKNELLNFSSVSNIFIFFKNTNVDKQNFATEKVYRFSQVCSE